MKLPSNHLVADKPNASVGRSAPAWPRSSTTPIEAAGALAAIVFLFALYSRIFDLFLTSFHIPLILSITAIVIAVIGGRFVEKIKAPTTGLLIALTAWLLLATVFSVWRGGSASVMGDWSKNCLLYIIIIANIRTLPQLNAALHVMAASFLLVAVLLLDIGDRSGGRLTLPAGMYANPNELGLALVSGFTLFWVMTIRPGRSLLVRLSMMVVLLLLFYLILESASRGAFIATIVALLYMSFRGSLVDKLKMLIIGLVVGSVALSFSGDMTFDRLGTALGVGSDQTSSRGRTDSSTTQRIHLIQRGIRLTIENPLLGAGPGMFATAENDLARLEGARRGAWNGTHNTYLQFSSEAGIPALLLFIAIIYVNFRGLSKVGKLNRSTPNQRQIQVHSICQALQLLWVVYVVSFIFLHLAFSFFVPALIGLTTAAVTCISQNIAKIRAHTVESARV